MKKTYGTMAATLLIALAGASARADAAATAPAQKDDLSALVTQVKPPARFKDHKPAWSVEETTYTFQDFDGPVTVPWYLIKDGERIVAGMPRGLFHAGALFVQDFRPGEGPKALQMPTERWHIETVVGHQFRTDAFIPGEANTSKDTYDFQVRGDTLVLTRKYGGTTTFNKWSHRAKEPHRVETTNVITFSVDPVLGYVVDAQYDTWTEQKLAKFEYVSAAPAGRHLTWKGMEQSYRVVISTEGKAGYHGYATNMASTQQHGKGGWCRDGGICAFLNDQTGWSVAYTNESGTPTELVVCGPHTDHDFTLQMPKIARETREGMTRYAVRHRMAALPPEITRHLWDTMEVLHKGESKLMLQMGVLDDMEMQPLPADGRLRGHPLNGTVVEGDAHSGRKAVRITGRSGVGSPTLCVKPNMTYRLEVWMKAVPLSAEEKVAEEARRRGEIERISKAAEAAKAKGKAPPAVPEFVAVGDPEAFMTVQYQEWPGGRKQGEPVKATVRKPGGWEHLVIEFDTPAWGPALDIQFVAKDCSVLMDDFKLAPVKKR